MADWLDDVSARMKRGNQILFAQDGELLAELGQHIAAASHRSLALWALELAAETAAELALRYPDRDEPTQAVELARDWAAGKVKMRPAQRAILDVHALAKDLDDPVDVALCHAVGQGCAVVHTPRHGLGYPIYELTALVRRNGLPGCREPVTDRVAHYQDRLDYWTTTTPKLELEWADFIK